MNFICASDDALGADDFAGDICAASSTHIKLVGFEKAKLIVEVGVERIEYRAVAHQVTEPNLKPTQPTIQGIMRRDNVAVMAKARSRQAAAGKLGEARESFRDSKITWASSLRLERTNAQSFRSVQRDQKMQATSTTIPGPRKPAVRGNHRSDVAIKDLQSAGGGCTLCRPAALGEKTAYLLAAQPHTVRNASQSVEEILEILYPTH